MEKHEISFENAIKKYVGEYCHNILYVDIIADTFNVLVNKESDFNKSQWEQPSKKLSDWFAAFADSPFCYDSDRDRYRQFTDFSSIKTAFKSENHNSLSLIYRRKYNLSDSLYSTVIMELVSVDLENEHMTAYLFERDISSELQKNEIIVNKNLINIDSGKRLILIVEDNEINLEILTDILSDTYQIIQALNVTTALELLQKYMTNIAAVILDIQLPLINGYEFLTKIKRDSILSKIPVIVASGKDSVEEERVYMNLGASEVLSKPFNPEVIKGRISNIIRMKESTAAMSMLQTDELTGLFNLQAFYYRVARIMENTSGKSFFLTILDVDRFKQINEQYGEKTGDLILRQVAEGIKIYASDTDICGRFGAARFLLFSEDNSERNIEDRIEELFTFLTSKCNILNISFKAGIYMNVDTKLSVSSICDRAITALNSINSDSEKPYALYDERQEETERRFNVMEKDMLDAYESGLFSVYYQPKHDAFTGKLMGAEALIRWVHPAYGLLSPSDFIPLFERNGFVSYADYYVLTRTCRNLKEWIDAGLKPVPISINVSVRDFERDDYFESIMKPLTENGVDPSFIHIEITENMLSNSHNEISKMLSMCKTMGFKIELDDFGTGYSSLTTMASMPIDIMKLDKSLMKNYKDEKKLKVLSTCISLAKSMNLQTIAEGVETEDQINLLKKYGCDMIQGYYYSKPLPENEFKKYLMKF